MLEEANKKKTELIQRCMTRKDEMRKWSQKHTHEQKYSLLESHAHHRATHLLRRASEIKQDQEDEVRTVNVTKDRDHNIHNTNLKHTLYVTL
jgi:hypothetical protein